MATVNNAQQQTATYIQNGERKQGVAYQQTTQAPAAQAYQAAAAPERQSLVDNEWYGSQQEAARKYYEESKAANQQAAAAAEERARTAAQEQRDALAAGYQGTNRQLYRDYMQRERTLPQQMAAQGYTGGLTESSRLRLGNSYQEALAENERAQRSQEAGINSQMAQTIYEAQQAATAADREAARQQYERLMALEGQRHSEDLTDRQAAYQDALAAYERQENYNRSDWEYQRALAQAEYERQAAYERSDWEYGRSREDQLADLQAAYARQDELYKRDQAATAAKTLAASGDFSALLNQGYSQAQVDYLTRAWLAQNPDLVNTWIKAHKADAKRLGLTSTASSGSSGSSGGGGSSVNKKQTAQIAYGKTADMASKLYHGGTSPAEISAALDASVNAGEISKKEADYGKMVVKAEAYAKGAASRGR